MTAESAKLALDDLRAAKAAEIGAHAEMLLSQARLNDALAEEAQTRSASVKAHMPS